MKGDCQIAVHQVFAHNTVGVPPLLALGDGPENAGELSRFVALTLGIERSAQFFAMVEGGSASLGSKIAAKLARDAMITAALGVVEAERVSVGSGVGIESRLPRLVVQEAFKAANQSVFDYASRMAAGGRCDAFGLVLVVDGDQVSLGRVGDFAGYLIRAGRLVRLFGQADGLEERGGFSERIGGQPQVVVDLSSVAVADSDLLIMMSAKDTVQLRQLTSLIFSQYDLGDPVSLAEATRRLAQDLFYRSQREGEAQGANMAPFAGLGGGRSSLVTVAAVAIGPSTIVLREVVQDFGSPT